MQNRYQSTIDWEIFQPHTKFMNSATNTTKNITPDFKLVYNAEGVKVGALSRTRTRRGTSWGLLIGNENKGYGSLARMLKLANVK